MKKVFASALVVGCLLGVTTGASACHWEVVLMDSDTLDLNGVTHEYSVYKYYYNQTSNIIGTVVSDTSWNTARAFAVSAGGYLATTEASEENSFVQSLLNDVTAWESYSYQAWLGGYQDLGGQTETDPASGWSWVEESDALDNNAWTGWNWNSGEPNGVNGAEDFLVMRFADGLWNDEVSSAAASNYRIGGFVVENISTAPVPEPATMLLFGTGLVGFAAVGRKRAK